jgi:hypothetical protein
VKGSAVTVRVVELSAVKDDDAVRWAALAEDALEPNPYLHPAVLLAAHRWLAGHERVWLVVAQDGARWLGLLSLRSNGRLPGTPLPYASTSGRAVEEVAAIRSPLIDRARADEVLDALLAFLGSRRSGLPGLLELTWQWGDGPLADAFRSACRRRRIPLQVRAGYERGYAWKVPGRDPRAHLSANRRKHLGRLRRGLERELGAEVVLRDRGGEAAAVDDFRALRSDGWKGRQHATGERAPGNRGEWLLEATQELAARDMLHVFELSAGSVPLFLSLDVELGGTWFGFADTYNEDYAKYSPGTIGRQLEVEHILGLDGTVAVDPCMHPRYVDSTAYYPDRRPTVTLLAGTRGAARLLLPARPLVATAVRHGSTLLRRTRPEGRS